MVNISYKGIMLISNSLSNYRLSIYLYDKSPSAQGLNNYKNMEDKSRKIMDYFDIDMATIDKILSIFGGSHYRFAYGQKVDEDVVNLFSKDKVTDRMEYLIKKEMEQYMEDKKESIPDKFNKDDIIYLDCTLALMMASMEAYNLNPEEEFFYDGGISMQNVFVKKMKELGVGELTIGAIIAECGGCYGCTYDGSEEDEETINFFMPDKIEERLKERGYYERLG